MPGTRGSLASDIDRVHRNHGGHPGTDSNRVTRLRLIHWRAGRSTWLTLSATVPQTPTGRSSTTADSRDRHNQIQMSKTLASSSHTSPHRQHASITGTVGLTTLHHVLRCANSTVVFFSTFILPYLNTLRLKDATFSQLECRAMNQRTWEWQSHIIEIAPYLLVHCL